jgi:hypothetical protein
MIKIIFLILLFPMVTLAGQAPSAARNINESWEISKKIFQLQESLKFKTERVSDAPWNSNVPYDKADLSQIPEFTKSADEVQKIFEDIRNIRFLKDPEKSNFPRRISWLYPIDGCFVRAEWVAHLLKKRDPKIKFGRVFIFGDLVVKTKESSSGSVSWWYHVAIIIRHQGKVYVIDPSLEFTRPIEFADWAKLQVPNPSKDAEIAICSGYSYGPASNCSAPAEDLLSDAEAADDISPFLTEERKNLIKLGRDPQVELGNNPPW